MEFRVTGCFGHTIERVKNTIEREMKKIDKNHVHMEKVQGGVQGGQDIFLFNFRGTKSYSETKEDVFSEELSWIHALSYDHIYVCTHECWNFWLIKHFSSLALFYVKPDLEKSLIR